MQRNIKLVIAYDGTDFHGWQTQPGVRTVQEELQGLIARVVRHPVSLAAASRTDAGVHARGQVANFVTESAMPLENLRRAITSRLPDDLGIAAVDEVPPEFHAGRDARRKLYRYELYFAPEVQRPVQDQRQRYSWHVWYPLEFERMRAAAALLVGCHDFAGFANQGMPRETTVRTMFRIELEHRPPQLGIEIEGDRFLYNQVRIMVGTLVEIGRGHWPPERISEILATCDRSRAGPTAPPHGLTLQWVQYDSPASVPHGT